MHSVCLLRCWWARCHAHHPLLLCDALLRMEDSCYRTNRPTDRLTDSYTLSNPQVDILVLSSQLGACCSYLIFVGDTMAGLVPSISHFAFVLMALPIIIPIVWLPDVGSLAPFR